MSIASAETHARQLNSNQKSLAGRLFCIIRFRNRVNPPIPHPGIDQTRLNGRSADSVGESDRLGDRRYRQGLQMNKT
jgi:hypothetical protein